MDKIITHADPHAQRFRWETRQFFRQLAGHFYHGQKCHTLISKPGNKALSLMPENGRKMKKRSNLPNCANCFSPRAAELLAGNVATEHDMREILTEMIERRGSQRAVAEELGVSQAYLGEALRGTRGVGAGIAKKLGWVKVSVFLKK